MVYKIPLKTEEEVKIMRQGGAILGDILSELVSMVKPDLEVMDLEKQFIHLCEENQVIPACKNYQPSGFPPFPTGLCISLNDQAVHCYPKEGVKLQDGDLLTIDTVIKYQDFYLDSAITLGVGTLSEDRQMLLDKTKEALYKAISVIKPGIRIGLISHTMQMVIENAGYSVLTEYAGHGIGKSMHEPPEVPCFGSPDEGVYLASGMVLAIEPLVCEKHHKLDHKNYWETMTTDHGDFAQFEHTVLVTDNGFDILTEKKDE